ncbi:hypothetical protein GJ744_008441 [Endocarpon pusillum]|uniref:Uncharacterized protein n=1 Tax=Endocarpon pusillum TaxID=364733 RepID=A0A8H7AL79_9EURO|nr:hypothetical protein GJ744_008441 [Endocarpon pusillum]
MLMDEIYGHVMAWHGMADIPPNSHVLYCNAGDGEDTYTTDLNSLRGIISIQYTLPVPTFHRCGLCQSGESAEAATDTTQTIAPEDTEAIPQQFYDELMEAASAYNVNVVTDPTTYNGATKGPNA